ncbi:MAG: DNA polymerase III subunit chi [Vitreoscilla sp.]|jgi:DNA polymerase-3 subunit chi|nr:DNA polymerase III subunit chi [Vitreoscilla sp.]
MAEVVFLSGVVDVIDYAVRLLRKKYLEGERVAVYGSPATLARLDEALWVKESLDFTPHHWLRGSPSQLDPVLLEKTPLWLLGSPVDGLGCTNGVNLGRDGLDLARLHTRVAEIVSGDESDKVAGRERWKHYKAQGHVMKNHAVG